MNDRERSRLIVALDVPTRSEALSFARRVGPHAGFLKVGSRLFTAEGPDLVRALKSAGHGIFLDLKYHDIPNTVAEAAAAAAGLGVDFFDVHASGGADMVRAAAEASREEASRLGLPRPRLLAVTVLTSMPSTVEQVTQLARLARDAGADGVVASAQEARAVRDVTGSGFVIVTPGIRPAGAGRNDQRRVATPAEAVASGADYIVVGRPVLAADDPAAAARAIVEEMQSAGVTP
ncbi:MAG: orotidine-5'-phosphate decarboxylase [Candidatus Eisenbacteria bacterium]|nr:orotidine-5'-phosphate decarboxylase [Candidatus Eisenbacteria bacterium]